MRFAAHGFGRRTFFPLFLFAAVALALAGCGSQTAPAAPADGVSANAAEQASPAPIHLLVGADVSGSTTPRERRRVSFALEDALFKRLPRRTPVTLWLYDTQARRIADAQAFGRKADFESVKREFVNYQAAKNAHGTSQAIALAPMAERAKSLAKNDELCALLLLTDGEDSDPAATKKAAAELAALPNVRAVWVVGVVTENEDHVLLREKLAQALAPLGDKSVITGAGGVERDSGLDKFSALVRRSTP